MSQTAKFGQPPVSANDEYVVYYFRLLFKIPNPSNVTEGILMFPGPQPNFPYDTRAKGLVALASIAIVSMTLMTTTRIFIRLNTNRTKLGSDDWLMIPATLISLGVPVGNILACTYGGSGKHLWDVSYRELGFISQMAQLLPVFIYAGLGLYKIAVALFLRKIIGLSSRNWKIAINTFIGISVTYTIVSVCLPIFLCGRPRWGAEFYSWIRTLSETPMCVDKLFDVYTGLAAVHIATDFVVFGMALVLCWPMEIPLSGKVRVLLLFSAALFTCLCAPIRVVKEHQLKQSPDFTWENNQRAIWDMMDVLFTNSVVNMPIIVTAVLSTWRIWRPARPFSRAFPVRFTIRGSHALGSHNEDGMPDEEVPRQQGVIENGSEKNQTYTRAVTSSS